MIYVVIPCYYDVSCVQLLLNEWKELVTQQNKEFKFLIIDDSAGKDSDIGTLKTNPQLNIEVLTPNQNIGHQMAILMALESIAKEPIDEDCILVMDGDGEDKVGDAKAMIDEVMNSGHEIVIARRLSRKRSFHYQLLYMCFLFLQKFILGGEFKTGNFSAFHRKNLENIILETKKTGCFSMSFYKLNQPLRFYSCHKAVRSHGKSKVGTLGAFKHALLIFKALKKK